MQSNATVELPFDRHKVVMDITFAAWCEVNPPALPACLVVWGLMTDCLSVLCFCLYSLS